MFCIVSNVPPTLSQCVLLFIANGMFCWFKMLCYHIKCRDQKKILPKERNVKLLFDIPQKAPHQKF